MILIKLVLSLWGTENHEWRIYHGGNSQGENWVPGDRTQSCEDPRNETLVKLDGVIATVARLERTIMKLSRHKGSRNKTSSSSEGSDSSEIDSEDTNLTRHEDREEQRGDDRRKGRPKITCPTFNRSDPISWLSRANQFFDLQEIERAEKVRYAAYYLEGRRICGCSRLVGCTARKIEGYGGRTSRKNWWYSLDRLNTQTMTNPCRTSSKHES